MSLAPAVSRTEFHALRVSSVEALTDDAVAVTFEVPGGLAGTYDFAPGASLTLRRVVDGVEHRRSYSICAPVGQPLRIGVREIPDGLFSRWLVHDVRPGDEVEVAPPGGTLRCDPSEGGRHLCIAAGSGITPMLSVAASVLAHPDAQVALVYGNRSTASVMFAEELADLKDRHHARFELLHVLSREPREVDLLSGRVDGPRLRRLLEALVDVGTLDHVWLCGPYPMILTAREVLAELGVPGAKVHAELFHVDEPPPELHHADAALEGASSDVTVILDGRSTTSPMPRGTTLLDSAQRVRGDLPFACRGGVCGTCRARVASGEVEMVRNYALEEHEVAADFVLTCQSFPTSDAVTLDFDA
ncbi:MAG: 1,2-phenylacetyl-CoA epoxidase subunit PaaE [Nocardioides sp.]|uniref:1,2-phenylacetyl-CoA epoxidase subunit PaaE n=1 Tax=Nocardioides sp. TaxID=35761 RepID=UPI003F0ECFF9